MARRVAALWEEWAAEDGLAESLGPATLGGGNSPSLTYPTTPLAIKVRIALGADLSADPLTWAWQDITQWVRFDLGINIETGRRENSGSVMTARGALKLDNRDGRFSRRNPTGPYYGLLSKNTPIWVTCDPGSGEKTRMEMFVNEWPSRWADKSATDATVTVQCAGVLRRLSQGRVVKSALRRTILGVNNAPQPVAFWPLEDSPDATQAASGLSVGTPMRVVAGEIVFGGDTGIPGIAQGPTVTDGILGATVTGLSSTGFSFEFAGLCNGSTTGLGHMVTVFMTGGTLAKVSVSSPNDFGTGTPQTQVYLHVWTTIGSIIIAAQTSAVAADYPDPDLPHHYRVQLQQSGSDVTGTFYMDGVAYTASVSSQTLGTPYEVRINNQEANPPDPTNDRITGTVVALAMYNATSIADHSSAVGAYVGDMAHERMTRVCAEEGILFATLASTSPTMGVQSPASLVELLRDCETAGGGVLHEKRWGLAYQSLGERYNAPAALALDFDAGHVAELPEPADDDQRTRNRWTVSRPDGSEYTAEQTTGPMGTGSEGPGVYDDSASVNTETDGQLSSQAGWRVHLGTIDEDRWPQLALNFTRNSTLIDAWTALSYGARVSVANPPAQMPPDALDLVIEGHSERFDSKIWTASINASPASAYRVVVVGSTDGNLGRVDAASSTLAADATSSDTTISVASPGALWVTGAVNFDIRVGGEQMTATAIGPSATVDTFTRTTSNGWGTADSGDAWTVISGAASQFSADGASGLMTHSAPGFCQISLPFTLTDDDITVTCTTSSIANYADLAINLRFTDTNNYYRAVYRFDANALQIDVRKAGTFTTISSVVNPASTGGATVGPVKLRFQVVGNALKARAWLASVSEPTAWDVTASDATLTSGSGIALSTFDSTTTKTFTFDDVTNRSPRQLFTVTRSVNGVVKAQTAGSAVSLWKPAVYAL